MNVKEFAPLVDTLPEPTLLLTGHGEIVAANPPALGLFGLSRSALQGQSLAILVKNPPEQIDGYLDTWARSRQLMPGMLMLPGQEGVPVRYRCLGAVVRPWTEQTPALLLVRLEKLAIAQSNFSLLTQKIEELSKEIRERMVVEQALRTSEERFRAVVEAAPNAILVVDAQGQIVLANPQAERLFGYTHRELLSKGVEQLTPLHVQTRHQDYRLNYQQVPQARPMGVGRDLYALCKDGSETPVEIGLNPFTTAEGRFTLVSIIDIYERKRAEQQLQESETRLRDLNTTLEQRVQKRTAELERSNADLDQFAYVASHDLKAPLRHVGNLASWIIEDAATSLPPKSQKHLTQLQERVKRMDRLLDDLLVYARIGRANGEVEAVAVDALISDIVYLLAPPAGFTIHYKGEMPILHTLRTPFALVFRNLISNAIKHHHRPTEGKVVITATDAGAFVQFRIRDNGPGIAAQYHERIFGLFQTLKSRDQVEGSGMGLAIVKRAVEQWGGTIGVESVEGQGTTFSFTWPKTIQGNDH